MKIFNIQEKDAFIYSNESKYIDEYTYLWSSKESFTNDTGIEIPKNVLRAIYEPQKKMFVIVDKDLKHYNFSDPSQNDLLNALHSQFDRCFIIALEKHMKTFGKKYNSETDSFEYDLELLKPVKKNEIKRAFLSAFDNGYKCSNGVTMDCKLEDIDKLDKGLRLTQKLNQSQMVVRDFYNQEHTLSTDEVDNMLTELGINWQTQWQKKVQLQKQVDEAQTVDEVLNINW